MEWGPIIRSMKKNKMGVALVVIEVAVTMAVVVNTLGMVRDYNFKINEPTGFDLDNQIALTMQPFDQAFVEKDFRENVIAEDLRYIRSLPGVKNATVVNNFPVGGSGSSTARRSNSEDKRGVSFGYNRVGKNAQETLGLELIEGRWFNDEEIESSNTKTVILNQEAANALFPDGDALGKRIEEINGPDYEVVIGIVGTMHGFWPTWSGFKRNGLFPGTAGSYNWGIRYMILVEPGAMNDTITTLEKGLLEKNNGRNINMDTMVEIKENTFGMRRMIARMLQGISIILVFVTALGITGLSMFLVIKRRRHIGIRRALGATKKDIIRYFVLENFIMTVMGTILGLGLTYGLHLGMLGMSNTKELGIVFMGSGVLALWAIGLFAVFFPAWSASKVHPAIATKSL